MSTAQERRLARRALARVDQSKLPKTRPSMDLSDLPEVLHEERGRRAIGLTHGSTGLAEATVICGGRSDSALPSSRIRRAARDGELVRDWRGTCDARPSPGVAELVAMPEDRVEWRRARRWGVYHQPARN